MLRRIAIRCVCALSIGIGLGCFATQANHAVLSIKLHLQRASFDPLGATPSLMTHAPHIEHTSLQLVQLATAPDQHTPNVLAAAGLRPLFYIPDNGWLVRASQPAIAAIAALPGFRWSGPLQTIYKFPADLEVHLAQPGPTALFLYLMVSPDREAAAVEQAVRAGGGSLLKRSEGPTGAVLSIRIPAHALPNLLIRDDVLWIEPRRPFRLQNDVAQRIVGATAARRQLLWLNGEGQIIAVTDSGLDIQANLSADFAGRVVRAFSNKEMLQQCESTDWSDRIGHGTHVAGTILGSGALSPEGQSFAGIAPAARLVVQSVVSENSSLDCLDMSDPAYLSTAYAEGARVQNASWGGPTGSSSASRFGRYTLTDHVLDTFLRNQPEHLFVVAAGNYAIDQSGDGVVDLDSMSTPATAKNVLAVGATESERPPNDAMCADVPSARPEQICWSFYYSFIYPPLANDFVSDNPRGMAAFSGRGPADDGRIKPEIVAPGVNIISARSHHPQANYPALYNNNYAYNSGTSMATPLMSGMAALVRQWLVHERSLTRPSSALLKALLLNGTTHISPGQYGIGGQREIPADWPNNVAGWGRASLTDTLGLGGPDQIWLKEHSGGISTGQTAVYSVTVAAGQAFRVTLAWTDVAAAPLVGKTLVNDLDLEIISPSGPLLQGNRQADLPAECRDSGGADRCNNVESIEIAAPVSGTYRIRVAGSSVPDGPQPFALAAHAGSVTDLAAPHGVMLQPIDNQGQPLLDMNWNAVADAMFYQVQISSVSVGSSTPVTRTIRVEENKLILLEDLGTYAVRVRACNASGCGSYSNEVVAQVTTPLHKRWLPFVAKP